MNGSTMNVLAGKLFGVIGVAMQGSREQQPDSLPPNLMGFGRGLDRDVPIAGAWRLHRDAMLQSA